MRACSFSLAVCVLVLAKCVGGSVETAYWVWHALRRGAKERRSWRGGGETLFWRSAKNGESRWCVAVESATLALECSRSPVPSQPVPGVRMTSEGKDARSPPRLRHGLFGQAEGRREVDGEMTARLRLTGCLLGTTPPRYGEVRGRARVSITALAQLARPADDFNSLSGMWRRSRRCFTTCGPIPLARGRTRNRADPRS